VLSLSVVKCCDEPGDLAAAAVPLSAILAGPVGTNNRPGLHIYWTLSYARS
jgi:hypothetical protein